MSIFGSIYKSMTGLYSASKALDNLSNNVANINTPGYKGNDVYFRSLGGDSSRDTSPDSYTLNPGSGSQVAGSSINFSAGDFSETNVGTDLAIDGNGLFILRNGQEYVYTRAGQFRFDEEGFLIEPVSEYRVSFLDESDSLTDFSFDDVRVSEPSPSTLIEIDGILKSTASEGELFPSDEDQPIEIEIFNSLGDASIAYLEFEKLLGNSWSVSIVNEDGLQLQEPQILDFNSLGVITSDTSLFSLNYTNYSLFEADDLEGYFSEVSTMDIDDDISLELRNGANLLFRNDGASRFADKTNLILNEGKLIDGTSKDIVAGLDQDGNLVDFDISKELTLPGNATSIIKYSGEFYRDFGSGIGPGEDIVYPPYSEDALPLNVFNQDGVEVNLTLRLVKETTNGDLWSVKVFDESDPSNIVEAQVNRSLGFDSLGNLLNGIVDVSLTTTDNQDISFALDFNANESSSGLLLESGDGTLSLTEHDNDGYTSGALSSISFDEAGKSTLHYSNGQDIYGLSLAIVAPGDEVVSGVDMDFSRVSIDSASSTSDISIRSNDGNSTGNLISIAFLDGGEVQLQYSSGERIIHGSLALAYFSTPELLSTTNGTFFENNNNLSVEYGRPKTGPLGKILSNRIEMSNVDLSQEFAEIIVMQRGYQASSQVLNVSNEMIEKLYNSLGNG